MWLDVHASQIFCHDTHDDTCISLEMTLLNASLWNMAWIAIRLSLPL